MNFSSIITLLLITFILIPGKILSQSEFKIYGTIRPRSEFRDGYKSLKSDGDKPAFFVNQRSRLSFDYKNDKIETLFTFFDYRVWGDQVWKKDVPSIGLHEAWASIKLTENSLLKIGRQQIHYDNGRLFSGVDWNQIGAAHDAILYRYSKNNFNLDLVTAFNQNKENIKGTDYIFDGETGSLFYKNLNILWLSKLFKTTELSFLTINDGFEEIIKTENEIINNPNHINYRYTSGLIIKQKAGNFNFIAKGFYQGGKLYTGTDVSAYNLNFDASYNFSKNTKLLVGIESLSGTDHSDAKNKTSNAFDILYGAPHVLNGRIDYFGVPSTTKQAGLINPYVRLDCSFKNNIKLKLEQHLFYLHQNYLPENPTVAVDSYLGHELDITLYKKFNDYMKIEGGYSVIFGSETMELLKGGDRSKLNNWAYVMLTISPTFFTSKNE